MTEYNELFNVKFCTIHKTFPSLKHKIENHIWYWWYECDVLNCPHNKNSKSFAEEWQAADDWNKRNLETQSELFEREL